MSKTNRSDFNRTFALYTVCMDYHSGQSSRGYRLMCLLHKRLLRAGIDTRFVNPRKLSHKPTYQHFEKQWKSL